MNEPDRSDAPAGRVSVVIIFLNAERFLQEAVESVLVQTYGDWELILVDDGSTDGSVEIARGYALSEPLRIRYLEHEGHKNLGMSASRNLGINRARGAFVALLDSDDVWFPQKLEEQVAVLVAHREAAMVFGRRMYWQSWTGRPEDLGRDSISESGLPENTLFRPPELLTRTYAGRGACLPTPSDLMFRKTAALELGGFEESFAGMYEDQAFLAKVYAHESVFVADACWCRYRQHPDSCVTRAIADGSSLAARRVFLSWLDRYLSRNGMQRTEVAQAIRRRIWAERLPRITRAGMLLKAAVRRAFALNAAV